MNLARPYLPRYSMTELGYLIENAIFSPAECDKLIETLSAVAAHRSRAGIRNLMGVSIVKKVASDRRLIEFARRITGKKLTPYKATMFEKAGTANWLVSWHQDTVLPLIRFQGNHDWGPWSRKAGIDYAHAPAWALEKVL